jgi:hypothetical protein
VVCLLAHPKPETAAARALGCRVVWSEDLNHGQYYDQGRV